MAIRDETLLDAVAECPEEAARLEREQVEQALEGDVTAFRAIVERHHRGLYKLALRMVGDRSEAEDVVQETLARAYRRLEHFDPRYRLSTWLYRIALNICRDHLKSPRRRENPHGIRAVPGSGEPDPAPGADACLEQARRARRLREALDSLSPSYRQIIVLKDLQELSYREIREMTGTPVTALKIRAIRARAKLRSLIEEREEAAA